MAEEIKRRYREMGEPPVAVRSSATAEDLPEASFAGQQSTFLNVVGADRVVQAVKECWASLFEARAIFYRSENAFEHMKVKIAVPVQRMVQSEFSGVMFTVEPVTQRPLQDHGRGHRRPGRGPRLRRDQPRHVHRRQRVDEASSRSASRNRTASCRERPWAAAKASRTSPGRRCRPTCAPARSSATRRSSRSRRSASASRSTTASRRTSNGRRRTTSSTSSRRAR